MRKANKVLTWHCCACGHQCHEYTRVGERIRCQHTCLPLRSAA